MRMGGTIDLAKSSTFLLKRMQRSIQTNPMPTNASGRSLTLRLLVPAGDSSRGIGLVLWTSPGDVKVGLDNHVGSRCVEGTTGGGELLLGEERAGEEGGRWRARNLEHRCNQWTRKSSSGGVNGGARKASTLVVSLVVPSAELLPLSCLLNFCIWKSRQLLGAFWLGKRCE